MVVKANNISYKNPVLPTSCVYMIRVVAENEFLLASVTVVTCMTWLSRELEFTTVRIHCVCLEYLQFCGSLVTVSVSFSRPRAWKVCSTLLNITVIT